MIRKFYEVDPMVCSKCGENDEGRGLHHRLCRRGPDHRHLKLTFGEKPPPSCVFEQVALMAAEEQAEYF